MRTTNGPPNDTTRPLIGILSWLRIDMAAPHSDMITSRPLLKELPGGNSWPTKLLILTPVTE
jgi:hypothetical protein